MMSQQGPACQPNRRDFLRTAGAVGVALAADGKAAAEKVTAATQPGGKAKAAAKIVARGPEPVRVAIIGTSQRGVDLCNTFAPLPGALVTHVCDVDAEHVANAVKAVGQHQEQASQGVEDFRRILDDKSVDAVVIATPDHWHAPMAILACKAGKHVYVEKPCSHNPREGEVLAETAAKTGRLVQQGTQKRSWANVIEAIEKVRGGEIGPVRLARGWYANGREMTGRRTPTQVPSGLNWDLWQGPAPRQPFTENVVHYKWHWYWHWGTGELGNNATHGLDLCRWGLGVDYPTEVTTAGGRYHFDDDQETPDTTSSTFTFGDKAIFWESRSCVPYGPEGVTFGVTFHGDKGTLLIDGNGYSLFPGRSNKPAGEPKTAPGRNTEHAENFLQSIRGKAKLACPIADGVKTVHLCHLGNMAYRAGGTLRCDPATGRILGNDEAMKYWSRQYDPSWESQIFG